MFVGVCAVVVVCYLILVALEEEKEKSFWQERVLSSGLSPLFS